MTQTFGTLLVQRYCTLNGSVSLANVTSATHNSHFPDVLWVFQQLQKHLTQSASFCS